jgi:two-component system response regulator FixJ
VNTGMTMQQKKAYIVDDDSDVCESLAELLSSVDIQPVCFLSGQAFLEQVSAANGDFISILDVQMPEMSGLEIQEQLAQKEVICPVIFLTGRGDVDTATSGMKHGALDFLQKPVDPAVLLDVVEKAFEKAADLQAQKDKQHRIEALFMRLTPREREICFYLSQGYTAKKIGRTLDISPRTAEIHRSRIMEKLSAASSADLVALSIAYGMREQAQL